MGIFFFDLSPVAVDEVTFGCTLSGAKVLTCEVAFDEDRSAAVNCERGQDGVLQWPDV